jgi:hypothetical protein
VSCLDQGVDRGVHGPGPVGEPVAGRPRITTTPPRI